MTLFIHRAERTDLLADELGDLLATPLADPFAEEVVVVPARGVERWLTQRLSHRLGVGERGGDGVCAGVRFLNPHSLVALLTGTERDDPWNPDRLVWSLLEVIDESLDAPWAALLAAHLGHGLDGEEAALRQDRRYSVARRLAGLFASYAVQRPTLITDWREGRDTDGAGAPLDDDLAWQPQLWRALLRRVDAPPPDVRHTRTLQRLEAGGGGVDPPGDGAGLELPPRLSLFGHTRLPVTEVELLSALGAVRDVHLWLPQASPQLWEHLVDVATGPVPRAEDATTALVRHPLLSSLGRDARELQRTLAVADGARSVLASRTVRTPDTLLGWLQHDLRRDTTPDPATRASRVVGSDDDTVQVHACHGTARQVDVLREVLVGLLQDDPSLEPRDILVMCPDIETYAPLIQAGFGLADVAGDHRGDGHPAHRLRVRLADRALTSTNPLLAVAGSLVALAGGRVSATEVLDLVAAAPVRHRFALSEDDLDQLSAWIGDAGIRWGLDSEHRGRYQLGTLGQNTWRFGLDRVLVGVAMAEDEHRWIGSALPVDDVPSNDIDLVGRFAELLDRLDRTVRSLQRADTISTWMTALTDGVLRLTDVPTADAWQVAQFERELARTSDAASAAGGDTALRLADVRTLLEHRLSGRPTRANFRTGTLTVCTMVPMRSVPHRVVCLVGLDDGVFPRTNAVDGDDALARRPVTGERDTRSEDRQLLLDAIMAATEKLVITYTGANEHSGAARPPAVPLGEILDALTTTATHPDWVRSPGDLVVRHPLQPFDRRNLTRGGLRSPTSRELLPPQRWERPFSFDRAALDGARAARAERVPVGPLLSAPLPPPGQEDVSLADLQQFFAHPVRHFLRTRLDVSSPLAAEETLDAMPITLDSLEKWAVGDRLLHDMLAGLSPDASVTAELLRGLLPPQELGQAALREICVVVQHLVNTTAPLRAGPARSLDVDIDLGGGRRLTGTVPGVHGDQVVSITYSSLKAKQRLASWLNLLALSLGHPDRRWTAHAVGRERSAGKVAVTGGLDDTARGSLLDLVDIYDRGRCEPLPLPVQTASAYADAWARARGTDDLQDVRWKTADAWHTDRNQTYRPPGENADPAHVRVFGAGSSVDVLLGRPRTGEDWNDAPTRLGQYALRVWEPLLAHEQVSRL